MSNEKIFSMSFARIYPLYLDKLRKKGRTKEDLDSLIYWLTGYSKEGLDAALDHGLDCREFFQSAPNLNPKRELIRGRICGVKLEEIRDPLMREIRYLDKLVDDLARGKNLDKILGS